MKKEFLVTELDRELHHKIWDKVLDGARNGNNSVSLLKKEALNEALEEALRLEDDYMYSRILEIKESANCVLCTIGNSTCDFCKMLGVGIVDKNCLGGLYAMAWSGDIDAIIRIRDLI